MLKCPVCRAAYRSKPSSELPEDTYEKSQEESPCHRCGTDLAPLIELYDRAIDYHRNAIDRFKQGNISGAQVMNDLAIELHSQHPKFHAFAGQLWAVQGDFTSAVRSWKVAQKLDPKNAIVTDCLSILTTLKQESSD
jgi:tetratricopeptide (TPR) repeat protein